MIFIKFYASQDFLIQDYSTSFHQKIADLFKVSEDEIVLLNIKSNLYHKGNEQTNWNVLIEITLDKSYKSEQEKINNFLVTTLGDRMINSNLIFNYIDSSCLITNTKEKYPRYLFSKAVDIKTESENYDDEDLKDDDKVYIGDAFKDFKK